MGTVIGKIITHILGNIAASKLNGNGRLAMQMGMGLANSGRSLPQPQTYGG